MKLDKRRQFALAGIGIASGGIVLIGHGLVRGETTETVIAGGVIATAGGFISQAGVHDEN